MPIELQKVRLDTLRCGDHFLCAKTVFEFYRWHIDNRIIVYSLNANFERIFQPERIVQIIPPNILSDEIEIAVKERNSQNAPSNEKESAPLDEVENIASSSYIRQEFLNIIKQEPESCLNCANNGTEKCLDFCVYERKEKTSLSEKMKIIRNLKNKKDYR